MPRNLLVNNMSGKTIEQLEYLIKALKLDCLSSSCRYTTNKTGMRVNGPCKCVNNIKDNEKMANKLVSTLSDLEKLSQKTSDWFPSNAPGGQDQYAGYPSAIRILLGIINNIKYG